MLDLETLNPEQRKAVETTEGPVLILAGAGSGKTRVLTYRIAFILDAGLAGPQNILAMTFTNKAAGEMKERIIELVKESDFDTANFSMPWMGTFHSIGVKLLKVYGELVGIDRTFSIYDSADQQMAIKDAMRTLDISIKEFNPRSIQSYISSAKNQLITPEDYAAYAQGYFQQVVADVYPEYQKILRDNNSVDFDDLIMLSIRLLEENGSVLEKLQEDFRYILVDEYQDTNHAQYRMIKLLAAKHKNICVVGDDDQSIYAFRGATIKNILSFEKDYPETKVVKLEQNYRSTKKILEASYQVISQNRSRKDKKLWTDNNEGENIVIYTARDDSKESGWVAEQIKRLINQFDGDEEILKEIAILYRTNSQSRGLEESFINYGIPYRIVGGVRFYDRKEIKDMLAYLRIVFNTQDKQSLERIINTPKRGIGKKAWQDLLEMSKSLELSPIEFLDTQYVTIPHKGLKEFGQFLSGLMSKVDELNIVDLIDYIFKRSGYLEMLEDGTVENEARIENVKELITVAAKFANMEPRESLTAFLDEVSLLEGIANDEEKEDRVTFMTIHSSKGLEFDYIFVIGMEENLFPHSNSMFDDKELEEERRLAYVAITRARKKLYLSHALTRTYFGKTNSNPPSRFIEDIDGELVERIGWEPRESNSSDYSWEEDDTPYVPDIDLVVGDKVKHEYFGVGTVKSIDSDVIDVDFGSVYGVKELMLEYAKLEKV